MTIRFRLCVFVALLYLTTAGLGVAEAADLSESETFELDQWYELTATDGPVTLHRIRLERKEGRLTKSSVARPHNQEYLDTLAIQLEYTNESDRKWRARIDVRWLDEDGQVIDGFSGNETLDKKSARKITSMSLSTLKYGVEKADKLEIEIHYEP